MIARISGILASATVLWAMASSPLNAADATEWQGSKKGQVRLLAGARAPDGGLYAGLQFDLAEGWKTYWRVPGDSGVPPAFDWKNSENAAAIDVMLPAPSRFRDNFGWNNGYKEDTLFPIKIMPSESGHPVKLDLTVYYGVCKELCIPGKAKLSLEIPAEGVSAHQALIGRYLQMVPQPPSAVKGLKVASVSANGTGDSVALQVVIEQAESGPVSLFVEGPDDLYFENPVLQDAAPSGQSRYQIRVDGAKTADDLKGAKLTFTGVQGNLRLEQTWTLD